MIHKLSHVFFLGIGGIGMSALARYFKHSGIWVGGYDRTSTTLTLEMEHEGIHIFYKDDPALLPSVFKEPASHLLVVYTPSIPPHNLVKNYFLSKKFELFKRSKVLGEISKQYQVIAVAGTHGKTTTASLITHLLRVGGIQCTSFLGGIATNYQTNFLSGESPFAVVEADEYDRSFHTLFPDKAVITSMDADHLDIYGTIENMYAAFNIFADQIKQDEAGNKNLIGKKNLPIYRTYTSYEIREPDALSTSTSASDIWADHISIEQAKYKFDYREEDFVLEGIMLQTPGLHNIENAMAAIKIALSLSLDPKKIKEGLASFLGVKRRFEYIFNEGGKIYIDDYAHHQDELSAFLKTVRALYPKQKILAIFQPHLYSRTRDFYLPMADSLSLADELLLMEVYPAREEPIVGVSSQLILDAVRIHKKYILDEEGILEYLRKQETEVIVTIGAGDIDRLILPIKNILKSYPRNNANRS